LKTLGSPSGSRKGVVAPVASRAAKETEAQPSPLACPGSMRVPARVGASAEAEKGERACAHTREMKRKKARARTRERESARLSEREKERDR